VLHTSRQIFIIDMFLIYESVVFYIGIFIAVTIQLKPKPKYQTLDALEIWNYTVFRAYYKVNYFTKVINECDDLKVFILTLP